MKTKSISEIISNTSLYKVCDECTMINLNSNKECLCCKSISFNHNVISTANALLDEGIDEIVIELDKPIKKITNDNKLY